MKITTLLLLIQDAPVSCVLLGYKKVGFGQGKYTGIGGKVELGETIEAATVREMVEETEVIVKEKDLIPSGHIDFFFPAKPEWDLTVHIFLSRHWQGTPTESREICPQWFEYANLPFDDMWADARHWYQRVLSGEHICAKMTFNPDNETLASCVFEPPV